MRIVLDANVFIAALLKNVGTASHAMGVALREHTVIVPEQFVKDLYSFMQQAQKKGVKVNPDDSLREIAYLQSKGAIQVVKTRGSLSLSPHAADNHYLEAAVKYNAPMLLSGDADLTNREIKEKAYREYGITILHPHEFLEWHKNTHKNGR